MLKTKGDTAVGSWPKVGADSYSAEEIQKPEGEGATITGRRAHCWALLKDSLLALKK